MIQEEIKLYEEPPPIKQTTTALSVVTHNTEPLVYCKKKMFNLPEIAHAVEAAKKRGFTIGATFSFGDTLPKYFVSKFEERPMFVDEQLGDPAVVIARKVGSMVEVPFSMEALTEAVVEDNYTSWWEKQNEIKSCN